jgi:hypothetical protein
MLNKKGQSEVIVAIIIILLIILGIFYGSLFLGKMGNDAEQRANCQNMAKNGFNTHLEKIHMLGVPFLDCYIQLKDGSSVPYDRFRAFD